MRHEHLLDFINWVGLKHNFLKKEVLKYEKVDQYNN